MVIPTAIDADATGQDKEFVRHLSLTAIMDT
jgi:hypothetical protein